MEGTLETLASCRQELRPRVWGRKEGKEEEDSALRREALGMTATETEAPLSPHARGSKIGRPNQQTTNTHHGE
jgi:hypothetical protein